MTRAAAHRARVGSLALLALLLAAPATAIDVFFRRPEAGEPCFGRVEVEVEVLSAEPIALVELLLDGDPVGRKEAPPWSWSLDIGQENRPRRFEAIATDASGARATAVRETPAITVGMELDLELQQLYVSVERLGERVSGLSANDFEIEDNGQPQELVTFAGGDIPLTAVLLVDTSSSMRGRRLKAALAGAEAFLRGLAELDEARVVLFSDRTLRVTTFGNDADRLLDGLADTSARGGTALNDHLYAAFKVLEARQGRRVVVLLSDGVDIESALSIDQVQWMADRSQALLYWIRPQGPFVGDQVLRSSSWRDPAGHRTELLGLDRLVRSSGGRVIDIERIDQAARAFEGVLEELRDQYVLGYYPTTNENDGRWHRVKVRVRRPGVTWRCREGYIDY